MITVAVAFISGFIGYAFCALLTSGKVADLYREIERMEEEQRK